MLDGFDPTQVIACALRPQGSWIHLATLVGFVWAAWAIAPSRGSVPLRIRVRRSRAASHD